MLYSEASSAQGLLLTFYPPCEVHKYNPLIPSNCLSDHGNNKVKCKGQAIIQGKTKKGDSAPYPFYEQCQKNITNLPECFEYFSVVQAGAVRSSRH